MSERCPHYWGMIEKRCLYAVGHQGNHFFGLTHDPELDCRTPRICFVCDHEIPRDVDWPWWKNGKPIHEECGYIYAAL